MLLLSIMIHFSCLTACQRAVKPSAKFSLRTRSHSARLAPAARKRPVSHVIEAVTSSVRRKPDFCATRRVDTLFECGILPRCRLILTAVQLSGRSARIRAAMTAVFPTLRDWPATTTVFIRFRKPFDAMSIETTGRQVNPHEVSSSAPRSFRFSVAGESDRMAGEGKQRSPQ